MRRFVNRASLILSVMFFVAIPVGMAAEMREWVVIPDRFEVGFMCYFWSFALVYFWTREKQPVKPPDA